MKKIFFISAFLILSLIIVNCNNSGVQQQTENIVKTVFNEMDLDIVPSFSNFNVGFEDVKMFAEKEFKYEFSDGTEILIPADAFVDENGAPVKGEVTFKYKSVKSPGEIISSGLHLLYKQGDSIVPFITGGMLQVEAEQNGKKLSLKEGKSIKMNYNSLDDGEYNFYRMDETTNEWAYISDANKFEVTEIVEEDFDNNVADNTVSYMAKPTLYNEDTDLILKVDLNHKNFKELSKYSNVMWKYKGAKTKEQIAKLFVKKWKKTELVQVNKNEYALKLISDKSEETLEIAPVFSKAEYNKAMELYDAAQKQDKNPTPIKDDSVEDNYVAREVNLIKLGVYNIDVCAVRDVIGIYSDFEFSDPAYNEEGKSYKYFVISNNGQTITRYDLNKTNVMAFFKNSDNKIISVLSDGKVAVVSSSDLKKMNLAPQSKVKFKMQVIDQIIDSPEKLDEIIAGV